MICRVFDFMRTGGYRWIISINKTKSLIIHHKGSSLHNCHNNCDDPGWKQYMWIPEWLISWDANQDPIHDPGSVLFRDIITFKQRRIILRYSTSGTIYYAIYRYVNERLLFGVADGFVFCIPNLGKIRHCGQTSAVSFTKFKIWWQSQSSHETIRDVPYVLSKSRFAPPSYWNAQ